MLCFFLLTRRHATSTMASVITARSSMLRLAGSPRVAAAGSMLFSLKSSMKSSLGLRTTQICRCFVSSSNDKTVLVLGSSGALGRTVSRHLGRDLGMNVIGADLVEFHDDSDWELDGFVAVSPNSSLPDLTTGLLEGVGHALSASSDGELEDQEVLDAIVVASGGWEGDPPRAAWDASEEEAQKSAADYASVVENMMRMNLHPVVAAGQVADRYMGEEGLFVVMGATAALTPTPGMMGYGLAKTAAHHLVQTMGATSGKSSTTKPKRKEGRRARRGRGGQYLDTLTAIGILPTMIDTPANRSADPNGDFDKWTKPVDIANEIGHYIENPPLRPHSGSLIKVFPTPGDKEGATFQLVR